MKGDNYKEFPLPCNYKIRVEELETHDDLVGVEIWNGDKMLLHLYVSDSDETLDVIREAVNFIEDQRNDFLHGKERT